MNKTRNHVASVKNRLIEVAKKEGKVHQLLLIRFFQERFLYRLSQSVYKNHFCLKGAALLYAIYQEKSRMTKDLDFLGIKVPGNAQKIREIFSEICSIEYPEDGVLFDKDTIEISDIIKDGKYKGKRIKLTGFLNRTRQGIQIDIGFADVVTPGPIEMIYPVILDLPPPVLVSYNMETVVAEKFEAMITLHQTNTRMKDFYDLFHLLQNPKLDFKLLEQAIQNTFHTRNTALSPNHLLFQDTFFKNERRNLRWQHWLKKMHLDTSIDFREVMTIIHHNLHQIYQNLLEQKKPV